jgi:hypothetical protein
VLEHQTEVDTLHKLEEQDKAFHDKKLNEKMAKRRASTLNGAHLASKAPAKTIDQRATTMSGAKLAPSK